MSILLERLTRPAGQDLEDLQDIYLQDPAALGQVTGGHDLALADALSERPAMVPWCTRFNSRLIAVALVEGETTGELRIRGLAVRASSRDRGVLDRLVRRIAAQFDPPCSRIEVQQPATPEADFLDQSLTGYDPVHREAGRLHFRRRA